MMTTDLKAGRELDALVAEKVMGLGAIELRRCIPDPESGGWIEGASLPEADCVTLQPCSAEIVADEKFWEAVPRYSTSIGDAWKVVEKLSSPGWIFAMDDVGSVGEQLAWHVSFTEVNGERHGEVNRISAPEAIVVAALRAVGAA